VLNEEDRLEYGEEGGMSPAGNDASEPYMEYSLGFVPFLPENPNGILKVCGVG